MRESTTALLFTLPALIGLLLFIAFPIPAVNRSFLYESAPGIAAPAGICRISRIHQNLRRPSVSARAPQQCSVRSGRRATANSVGP